jgi:hypothetical protein
MDDYLLQLHKRILRCHGFEETKTPLTGLWVSSQITHNIHAQYCIVYIGNVYIDNIADLEYDFSRFRQTDKFIFFVFCQRQFIGPIKYIIIIGIGLNIRCSE